MVWREPQPGICLPVVGRGAPVRELRRQALQILRSLRGEGPQAQQGVILVTINYRLAFFGFLMHPALAESQPDEPYGNYGLMDAVAALEWVQRNIAAFGGDPDNVMIFGESAGAGMTNHLMVMPSSKGLFHRAVLQSGAAHNVPSKVV